MGRMVLWDTACNFNVFISNQSIFNSHNWGNYSSDSFRTEFLKLCAMTAADGPAQYVANQHHKLPLL